MPNRNQESHASQYASKNIGRSKFDRSCSHKTTINTGDIVPIYVDEVLPGDTVQMNLSSLVRMSTPIAPVMDNAYLDTYFFFIPRRLVWEHWKEFMGENTTDAWTQDVEYQIPETIAPSGGWGKGTIANYMGARMNTENIKMDSCFLRAYALTIREWFRNQNVSEPPEISTGDENTQGSNGSSYVTDLQKGGKCAKAAKYGDYFTKALPSAQKGPDVYLPIANGNLPVITDKQIPNLPTQGMKMRFYNQADAQTAYSSGPILFGADNPKNVEVDSKEHTPEYDLIYTETSSAIATDSDLVAIPSNLWADTTNVIGTTINQMRQALAIQRMYELDAIGGTRYIEILAAHFGVNSPDARLQRPEYLGGKRIAINMSQVIQQSSTNDVTPQGNTAAMSLTIDTSDAFEHSFVEHGILLGLAVVRTDHTYQQGINRIFSRRNRFDFYFPELANIGEQYIKNKEIYAQGTAEDDEAFGYQEAWAEYRYGLNRISGELSSDYATPLDVWHYGDDYSKLPTLSDEWIKETDVNVKRTLAVQNQDQFICDFYFNQKWIRPLPVYSIPSLTGWN